MANSVKSHLDLISGKSVMAYAQRDGGNKNKQNKSSPRDPGAGFTKGNSLKTKLMKKIQLFSESCFPSLLDKIFSS